MLSPRAIYGEIFSNDEAFRLFCSIAASGEAQGGDVESLLRTTARAEIAVYRDVSKAVMAHLGRTLNWPRGRSAILAGGIDAVYLYERLGGWRRMVKLRMPARRDPLGTGVARPVARNGGYSAATSRSDTGGHEPVTGPPGAGHRFS
jgi:hypothetical protein